MSGRAIGDSGMGGRCGVRTLSRSVVAASLEFGSVGFFLQPGRKGILFGGEVLKSYNEVGVGVMGPSMMPPRTPRSCRSPAGETKAGQLSSAGFGFDRV